MTTSISDKIHHALSQIDNPCWLRIFGLFYKSKNLWDSYRTLSYSTCATNIKSLLNNSPFNCSLLPLVMPPRLSHILMSARSPQGGAVIFISVRIRSFAKRISNKLSTPNKVRSAMLGCAEKNRSPTLASTIRHAAIVASS